MRSCESKSTVCNACGRQGNNLLLIRKAEQRKGFGTAELYRCSACKTVHLGAIPDSFDSDLYAYYERYRSMPREQVYLELTRLRYEALLENLESKVEGRDFLDVGCGLGGFVEAATGRGWAGVGIDLASIAVDIGSGFGLPLKKMDFFTEELQSASFDLITMLEFIEHVPAPGRFLARAEELLKPNGLIYLTTPNFNSIDRFVLKENWEAVHIEHLSYFTPESVSSLVRGATSLAIVEITTKNLSTGLVRKLLPSKPAKESGHHSAKQAVRLTVEQSPALRMARKVVNALLRSSGLGSSMALVLKKVVA